jgi:hypothetical protein
LKKAFLLLVIAFHLCSTNNVYANDFFSTIEESYNLIELSFENIYSLEKKGADVTELYSLLNMAIEYNSLSQYYYNDEDLELASQYVTRSIQISTEIINTNIDMLYIVRRIESRRINIQIIITVVSTFLIIISSLYVWNIMVKNIKL